MCFLDILVVFRLGLGQISFNPVENAFATQQLAFLATSIAFYHIVTRACTEIKILSFCTRKWPTSLGFSVVGIFFCLSLFSFLMFLMFICFYQMRQLHTEFKTRDECKPWPRIDTLIRLTKRAQNHILWGCAYLYSLKSRVPPPKGLTTQECKMGYYMYLLCLEGNSPWGAPVCKGQGCSLSCLGV